MSEVFNIDGAKKKLLAAKQIAKTFTNLHRDGALFMQKKLTTEILNLASTDTPGHAKGRSFIRRITGGLIGSLTEHPPVTEIDSTKIFFNVSAAPYVFDVFEFAKSRYGQTPIQLVLFFYADYIRKKMSDTIIAAFQLINSGKEYKYYNPY